MTRSLKTLMDITSDEMTEILSRAKELKARIKRREPIDSLKNRVVGMLFEKPSTRTRASFESAISRLGASAVYMPSSDLQLKRGEPVKDTARMFGGYFDCLVARVYKHKTIQELAEYSGIPIINALCDLAHPTQAICDLLTVLEAKGDLKGLKLTYVGDGNNVCHSLLLACAHTGMNMTAACPNGFFPSDDFLSSAKEIANSTGSTLEVISDVRKASEDADVLYTDTWVSMGEDDQKAEKMKIFAGYQINSDLMKIANKEAIAMHCLPAYRGCEITEEVMEGPQSVIWQQGENKMYAAIGVLDFLFG
ncbi:MAG: ornithine carbamoyltransferase [Deltaproteobacteria bacterium]|jgi:ornithine carbamoyltransferase|nr:ornithine carbamoyltransferase [Deltaproteobacteria bacterium]